MLTFFLTLSFRLEIDERREFNQFGRYEEQRKKKTDQFSRFFSPSFSGQMELVEIP